MDSILVRCKKTIISLCMVSCCFLSSCFDIVETVQLNPDGSGNAQYKINLSQSKTKISSLMLLDSVRGYEIPSEQKVHSKLQKLKSILSEQKGITAVEVKENWLDFIFEVSMDFGSVNNLNDAMMELSKGDPKAAELFFDPYSYENKKFSRRLEPKDVSEFEAHQKRNLDVLQEANYICIFKFPKEIEKQSNADYSASKSGKATFFRASLLDLIEAKKNLKNTIDLK